MVVENEFIADPPPISHKTLFAWLWGSNLYLFQILFLPVGDRSIEPQRTVTITVGAGKPSKPIIVRKLSKHPYKKIFTAFRYVRLIKAPLPTDKQINNHVKFNFSSQGKEFAQPVYFYNQKAESNRRLYYVPFSPRKDGNQARHLRRTNSSTLVFVQRPLYQVEHSIRFKVYESRFVGALFFLAGRISDKLSKRKKYVFYEKFSSKAEEGTFELFLRFSKVNPYSYFVLSRDSKDFERIAAFPRVVEQFSLQYYWLIYTANTFVGTEVPTHLSILRSNNSWLRRRIYIRPYFFLQHGIIYMKNLGRSSIYVMGREGEPDLIVASSQKEKQVIMRDLLLPEDRIVVTGLGQFSLIEPRTISLESPDIVTIMLTWRPYDEHVSVPSDTAYIKVLSEVVQAVSTAMPKAQCRILAHPKFQDLLSASEFSADCWQGTVSEALLDTKLLITDYSSIAYNAFYRGSAVLYYQPDLDEYEEATGELIPKEDEYIGYRAFTQSELELIISKGQTAAGHIDLEFLRNTIHQDNYLLINEFDDGQNIERIAETIVRRFHSTE